MALEIFYFIYRAASGHARG